MDVTKSYLLATCVCKGIVANRTHTVRNGIVTRDTCGISYKRTLCIIKQNSAIGYKRRICYLYINRSKIDIANESSTVYTCNGRGKLQPTQRGAIRKREVSNSRKTALTLKDKGIKTYIVIESIFADLRYSRRNTDLGKICAILKRIATYVVQSRRKLDLTDSVLSREGKITDRGDGLSFNLFGDCNIATVSRIGTNFNRTVGQSYVGEWDSVVLVYPMRIQSYVRYKFILVICIFLRTLRVIVPAVKNSIKSFGFGKTLKCMIADKYPFFIFKLVRHHIVCDRSPLFQNESRKVERAISVIPVLPKRAKIITGRIENFRYVIKCHISVL